MKLDEKQLQHACKQVLHIQIESLPDIAECPMHDFDEAFEQDIQRLIIDLEKGNISPAKAPMGWQYYIKKSTTAVLIAILLVGVTMPETLLAAYRFITAHTTVTPEYTQHNYSSTAPGDSKLQPVQIEWLPNRMRLNEDLYREYEYRIDMEYIDDSRDVLRDFTLTQKLLTETSSMTYVVDTENAEIETRQIGADEVTLIYKHDSYQYIWLHDKYHISGQSNLSRDELIKILENIVFSD